MVANLNSMTVITQSCDAMIIYSNTKKGFCDDYLDGKVIEGIKQSMKDHRIGFKEPADTRAWKDSVTKMVAVLQNSKLPDDADIFI